MDKERILKIIYKITENDNRCGPSAFLAYIILEYHGFSSHLIKGFVDGEAHCWVESQGDLIDPTKHQFKTTNFYTEIERTKPELMS